MSLENISTLRLWIYRLISFLIIPLVILLLIEGGLRFFGVGHSVNYTSTATNDGQEYYIHNTRFVEQFFPREIARQPYHFTYPVRKSANTFRIFILGASAAQGDPEHSYGFSRILNVLLRERFPSINFEIINTSITATNSHVVLPIARDVSQHEPDLAIIYLGNNEIVGPFGSGTVFSKMSPNISMIRAGIKLKTTRIGQVMNNFISNVGSEKHPDSWQGMEMFLGSQFRADSPALETVYSHYHDNLSDIVEAFRKRNTPVILSTVGSNLKDSPPFASLHKASLTVEDLDRWESFYEQGLDLYRMGESAKALSAFLLAEQIDKNHAELQFVIGQSYLQSGDYLEARKRFVRARDLDTLRFRADSRINDIVRSVGDVYSGRGLSFLDATDLFEEQSFHNIPGKDLFFEHVHFTFHGNYILARQVAEQVLPFLPEKTPMEEENTEFLSEQECSDLLALGPFDILRVQKEIVRRMARPPFSNQLDHDEQISLLQNNLSNMESLMDAEELESSELLYQYALQNIENDPWLHFNYAVFLKEQKKEAEAITQFQKFLKMFPQDYKAHHELAILLADSGQFKEAIEHYQNAIRLIHITKVRTELRMLKAYALARLGRYDESMDAYTEVLSEDPSTESTVNAYHAMAKLVLKTGTPEEALNYLEKAIARNNGEEEIADVYFNYGHVLNQLKLKDQAVAAYKEAIKVYEKELLTAEGEDKQTLLMVLGRSYFAAGDFDKGITSLQQAINMAPAELDSHLTLISALARNGRKNEAIKYTDQALQVMSELSRPEAIVRLRGIKQQLN